MSIVQRNTDEGWISESLYAFAPKVAWQIVLEMDDRADYTVYLGAQDPNFDGNQVIFRARGPRTVTIPWPLAGLAIQEYKHLGFYGGSGRMTVWFEDLNFIAVKQEILHVIVTP